MFASAISRLRHGVPDSDLESLIDRKAIPAYAILILGLAGVIVGFFYTGFALATVRPSTFAGLALIMIFSGMLARRYQLGPVAPALEGLGFLLLSSVIAALATILLCTLNAPLVDGMLADADKMVAFDVPLQLAFLKAHPRIVSTMHYIYQSFGWQPALAVVFLSITRQSERCRLFVTAWLIAVAICVLLSPLFPAVGTFSHAGLHAGQVPNLASSAPWQVAHAIAGIRDGSIRVVDDSIAFLGLISFPSVQAAGAVLVAWAFWRTPILWPVFLALNAAVAISAIVMGAHYLVDILAGFGVAALAIGMAKNWAAPAPAKSVMRLARA
ncbi:phosphatase PAP2 family protein [Sphingomonas panacisoli]|uniref:Phosphatase PAP2 family protein n=1 Tax=Sphingomonas panacisoli TaxID=1813879 RepID=A0A5B8LK87_9SPHN|nr:phosphatase PAP2 family protein [Sphingomonas panacisoli]QDZ08658.1 phosphatase PAP2 family protein [Sphingomonas panacisoli]